MVCLVKWRSSVCRVNYRAVGFHAVNLQSSEFIKCSRDQVGTALATAGPRVLESARSLVDAVDPFLRPPNIELRMVSNG